MKITLRDGSLAHIRPICADDQAGLFAFYQGLSADSRAVRFQGSIGEATLRKLAAEHTKPASDAFGVVALSGSDQNIVGDAMWSVIADGRAEIAFGMRGQYDGRG